MYADDVDLLRPGRLELFRRSIVPMQCLQNEVNANETKLNA